MSASSRKPIIGVAGGIGSGKSMVAQQLESLGCAVFDADTVAKQMLRRPNVRQLLIQWWGEAILDEQGHPDRRKIARIIFDDPSQRQRLENLVHPLVGEERDAFIARAQADPTIKAIVLDTPLLFESGLHKECDRVIFVHASHELRAERVQAQRGWDPGELDRREKNQMPLDKKLQLAHDIIENRSSEAECLVQVRDVLTRILESS